jgi:hypothetical protein
LEKPCPARLSEAMGEEGYPGFRPFLDKTFRSGKAAGALFWREINRPIPSHGVTNFFAVGPKVWQNGRVGLGRLGGVCMSYRKACLILLLVVIPLTAALAQVSHSEQVQIAPPLIRAIDPPAPDATAAMLEQQGDALHSAKLYLDALDYYRAALVKAPDNAPVLNKMCRTELLMNRWREARKSCERAIKVNHAFAEAYGNLAVGYYGDRKYGAAVKQCNKAIAIDNNSASFFNNLGAAYFAEKKFEPAVAAYQHALQLDPQVFERSSRAGIEAQLAGPEDRARFDYTVAKLYAKMGFSERSLEYLKKAMEDGYKDLKNVYKDEEFALLRKNPRFTELMASKTTTIPDLPD